MLTCLLSHMEISNLSLAFPECTALASCHRARRTSRWIWNLHRIHTVGVLRSLAPTRPHQIVLLLLICRISDFCFIIALMPLQVLFCTFIVPWHKTQVHVSSLDMHADVNFNKKKTVTQITDTFQLFEHISFNGRMQWSCLESFYDFFFFLTIMLFVIIPSKWRCSGFLSK